MKKSAILLLVLLLITGLLLPTLHAQNNTNNTTNNNTKNPSNDKEKIELGFECLEKKADNCKGLSIQETALTILASPDKGFDACVKELEGKAKNNHFGNVRNTALAILALEHAGKDTENYEEWLLEQERNPEELVWYLQQDSNEASECSIGYDSKSYTVTYGKNKKISSDAGSCLERSQSNFWLRIDPDCYDNDFSVQCDKEFISSFLYKNKNADTVYVLERTESSAAYGILNMSLKSKCFGDTNKCNYEATAWASLALLRTKHDIDAYIPYLIALSETNEQYLPEAFIYLITDYEDYANKLLEAQKIGNYWIAKKSAYGKFYDSSLALIALGRTSSSEKVSNAKEQLLFSQGSNGCWSNSIRDTAMVLWALEGRAGRSKGGGSSTTTCASANFYCIPNSACPQTEVLNNFYCSGLSTVCCKNEHLEPCTDMGGTVCTTGTVCSGNAKKASDAAACCLGTCETANKLTECEEAGYACRTSTCSSRQEKVDGLTCNQGKVCCKPKTTKEGSSWTLIILLIILIILVILAIIFRKKLGLWWFALRTKFRKDKGTGRQTPSNGRPPPRYGGGRRPPGTEMNAYKRMPTRRRMPPTRQQPTKHQDKEFSDTFSKLRGYTK